MSETKDTTTFEWDDEKKLTGTLRTKIGVFPRYSQEHAVAVAYHTCIKNIIIDPSTLQKLLNGDEIDKTLWVGPLCRYLGAPLSMSYPKFKYEKKMSIYEAVINGAKEGVLNFMSSISDINESHDNFTFLAHIGGKIDWKHYCPSCDKDKHVGKTCSCGHTEIVMFRPCGHTMCIKPCYIKFREEEKLSKLKPIVFKINGKDYTCGQLSVDQDTDFDCPICSDKVVKTFRAETVKLDESMFDLPDKLKNII